MEDQPGCILPTTKTHQEDRLGPKQVAVSSNVKRQRALSASCALAANKSLYLALIAGAVYDQKLGKWMRHKYLLNHPDPDPETRKLWTGGGEKEFGRLCQGNNNTKGKYVLRFIQKDEVSSNKRSTFSC